jgi:hypothetical protein
MLELNFSSSCSAASSAGAVRQRTATRRVRRDMPDRVPVALLGRVAIDRQWQRRELDRALLRDAVLRVISAAGTTGCERCWCTRFPMMPRHFYERLALPAFRDRSDEVDDHDR